MGFSYRGTCTITSDSALLPATQTNFTVRVSCIDASLKSYANGGQVVNTHDICFFSDSAMTTLLTWEIDKWNATTGGLDAWVLLPSCALGTVFYIGIGSGSITSFQGGATGAAWATSNKGEYHFPDGSTLGALDTSGNSNDGTITAATAITAGQIVNSASFNGTSALIQTPNQLAYGDFTFAFWARVNGTANSGAFFGKVDDGANGIVEMFTNTDNTGSAAANSTFVGIRNDGGALVNLGAYSSSTPYDNNFNHHVLTRTGTTVAVYLNGVAQTLSYSLQLIDSSSISSTRPISIGARNNRGTPDTFCACDVDNFRIENVARTANWVTALFNSEGNVANFCPVTFAKVSHPNLPLLGVV